MSEVERPDALAGRINAEHRACVGAMNGALGHALAAGSLLMQAKDQVKHGEWGAWVDENFEGSKRTAEIYMRLASRRAEVEAAKAQSAAYLSIAGALRSLTREVPRPWQRGLGPPLTEKEREAERRKEARRVAEARRRQWLEVRTEYAIRTGDWEAPPGVPEAEWTEAVEWVQYLRTKNHDLLLDALGHELKILARNAPPEVAVQFLMEPTNDDESERRRMLAAELRDGAEWLARVIEGLDEAEGAEAL